MPSLCSPRFPYTTLFRSIRSRRSSACRLAAACCCRDGCGSPADACSVATSCGALVSAAVAATCLRRRWTSAWASCNSLSNVSRDRKSTRLNSSHLGISYAVPLLSTLSLHDALPIYSLQAFLGVPPRRRLLLPRWLWLARRRLLCRNLLWGPGISGGGCHLLTQTLDLSLGLLQQPLQRLARSEEHTSELQSLRHLVCRPSALHAFPTRRSSDLFAPGVPRRAASPPPAVAAMAVARPQTLALSQPLVGPWHQRRWLPLAYADVGPQPGPLATASPTSREIGRAHV